MHRDDMFMSAGALAGLPGMPRTAHGVLPSAASVDRQAIELAVTTEIAKAARRIKL